MFCPRCAMQNLVDAKFCRACGVDLETISVTLAAAGSPYKPKKKTKQGKQRTWAEKRSQALRDTIQGAILIAASAVICVAFAVFFECSRLADPVDSVFRMDGLRITELTTEPLVKQEPISKQKR